MTEAWLSFGIVIVIQFLLFIVHATYERRLADVPQVLGKGILSGLVLGLLFDLILGKSFNFFTYELGFNPVFLVLNAALFYGLFVANTLLMQQARLAHFLIWTLAVGAVTEFTNLFLHLWTWKYSSLPLLAYLGFLSVGYIGIAILMAAVWHMLGYRFIFIDALLKR